MARIFLSHNSQDALEAVALKRWLADNGWDDVFLDLDARDGLSPGERWKDALRSAADRCEAVLCLVSPTWLASAECKLEFRYAETLRKQVFLAIIKPCDPQDLPPDWQWCPLYGEGAQTTLRFEFREQPADMCVPVQRIGAPEVRPGEGRHQRRALPLAARQRSRPGPVPRTEAAGSGRCGGVLRAQRANPAWHGNPGGHAQERHRAVAGDPRRLRLRQILVHAGGAAAPSGAR